VWNSRTVNAWEQPGLEWEDMRKVGEEEGHRQGQGEEEGHKEEDGVEELEDNKEEDRMGRMGRDTDREEPGPPWRRF
jgi:hypothetical protein